MRSGTRIGGGEMIGWQFALGAAAAAVAATVFAFLSRRGETRSRGLTQLAVVSLAVALACVGWNAAFLQTYVEQERARQHAEHSVATQRIARILQDDISRLHKRLTALDPKWEERMQQEDEEAKETGTPAPATTSSTPPAVLEQRSDLESK